MEGADTTKAGLEQEAAALEGEHIPRAEARAPDDGGPIPTSKAIVPIFRIGFDLLAPAWKVTDAECEMLGEGYGPLLDKYLGRFDFGVELTALIVTGLVFGPRMKKPRKEPRPVDDQEAPPAEGAAPPG